MAFFPLLVTTFFLRKPPFTPFFLPLLNRFLLLSDSLPIFLPIFATFFNQFCHLKLFLLLLLGIFFFAKFTTQIVALV